MIVHINKTRFDVIQSLSFRFPIQHPVVLTQPIQEGDNEIHLLEGEHATCRHCGAEFDSVEANTPAEFAAVKTRLAIDTADRDRAYFAPGMQFQKRQALFIKTANYDPPIMLGDGTWIPAQPAEENS